MLAIVVQARVGSSWLPGKVLLDLAGKPALHRVLSRCARVPGADRVVCAVPDQPASAPLEAIAEACGAAVYRGSEADVLDRYLGAAQKFGADIVMRVTSDCPLIDPDVCEAVIETRAHAHADYAANNLLRTFPHGLDCEVFTVAALEKAAAATSDPHDHEHVTPWLRREPNLRRANVPSDDPTLAGNRWTLDYPEDLTLLRAILEVLPDAEGARMRDVLGVLRGQPELAGINSALRQWGV